MTVAAPFVAGSRAVQVHDAVADIRFPLWLLYPTLAPAQPVALGPRGLPLLASPDAAVCAGEFPLVVLSHGGGSTPHVYRGTAAFLASHGFIVALPEHHRDNRGDSSWTGSAQSLQLRARHVRLAIDAVLGDDGSGLRGSVAGNAVALIGHSMGGTTALTVAGGQPWTRDGERVDTAGLADARVQALVLLAPAAAWFAAPGALRAVTQPVLLMAAEQDAVTPPQQAQLVADGVPDAARVEHTVVPGAGHFAFLTPFPPAMRTPALAPALDPPGFDRDAFHVAMNLGILAFLQRTSDGGHMAAVTVEAARGHGSSGDQRQGVGAARSKRARRRRALPGAAALTAALLLLLLSASAHGEPPADGIDAASQARVAATVERLARQHKVCAVAYATLTDGAVTQAGGANGCDAEPAPDAASVFQAASLSKTVFAYGVLGLVAQGRFALDVPLVGYLPEGYLHRQNPFDGSGPVRTDAVTAPELGAVTARMVLQHTSGLPNWSSEPLAFDFAPGSAWQYSGEGFMLLQRAVESVTVERLDAFMQREVFDPLGMRSSRFRCDPSLADKLVAGVAGAGRMQPVRFTQPIAAASLYTTAHDYALFLAALLNDAALLRLTLAGPVSVEPTINLAWGLGWAIEQGPGPQAPLIWQWGNNPGYRAFAMASTATRSGFVMLTNSEGGLALAEPLAAALLPGPHPIFKFRMLH